MAWGDKPTDAQINAVWHWFYWKMPTEEAKDAVDWLKQNATRKQVSEELGRLRELSLKHALNRDVCLSGEVWQEYFNSKVGKE